MLSQLLTELDGVRQLPVALVATSNSKQSIDPALLRRLAVHIEVPLPTHRSRCAIIDQHLKHLKQFRKLKYDFSEDQLQMMMMDF
ncbi:hypothetical protein A4X09_0g7405 [Tilletia walkeri]|uniref:ATPase AAA-type core domain-containing protein n=1 Tax=Tilletia walkeri TaxID=117179 RepID=A0A8X7N3A5_9BASI|nr:hypothetical protein A4X09_0g7405 [Tilletia walkeri]